MANFFSPFLDVFLKKDKKEKELKAFIKQITGEEPQNLSIYFLALKHSSINKEKKDYITHSNERLEYLGDAILGAIVAEYLFKKYPFKDEGFLTDIRSRIVNGEALGILAKRIGLSKFIEFNSKSKSSFSHKSMYGDAMEALVGAVYLDRGFKFCRQFVLEKLLENNIDIDEIVSNDVNYKSKLIMWGQSRGKHVKYEIVEEQDHKHYKEFVAQISIEGESVSQGRGSSKKKAEQDAARRALETLQAV
ncbi:MAG: ribonuclease III [Cytophagales bacterium]